MQLNVLSTKVSLQGKTVIIRASLNVPLEKGRVDRDGTWRLGHDIETIKDIRRRKGRCIVIGHLGRPNGKRDKKLSVRPVANYIREHVSGKLTFVPELFGHHVRKSVAAMKDGEGLVLENVRFYRGEEENDASFAKKIASYGDLYVDEAFSVAHRKHASNVAITRYLPSYAGTRFTEEVETLERIIQKPKKPLALIIGGAKVVTKLGVINQFIGKADSILLGGLVVNSILYRKLGIHKSFSKEEKKAIERLFTLQKRYNEIALPVDVMRKRGRTVVPIDIRRISAKDAIIDIGPRTAKLYSKNIREARTIIWNGPMGLIEDTMGKRANQFIAKEIALSKAKKYIGGGETVESVHEMGLMKKMTFVSTGGGAMLEFLSGSKLPAIEVLRQEK